MGVFLLFYVCCFMVGGISSYISNVQANVQENPTWVCDCFEWDPYWA
jgi:hypothetical protein